MLAPARISRVAFCRIEAPKVGGPDGGRSAGWEKRASCGHDSPFRYSFRSPLVVGLRTRSQTQNSRPTKRSRRSRPNELSSPGASSPARGAPSAACSATAPAPKGRISHLQRGYGLRGSRLKGHAGQRTWTGWSILAYNLDIYTRLT